MESNHPSLRQQIYSLPRYHLRYIFPLIGDPDQTWTDNFLRDRQVLWPFELQGRIGGGGRDSNPHKLSKPIYLQYISEVSVTYCIAHEVCKNNDNGY